MSSPRAEYQASDRRPRLQPLAGRPLIVHVVVNVEAWLFGEPLPRKLITSPHGHDVVPDLPNWGWAEYGLRAGLPRIFRSLRERGLPASCNINAAVIDVYPEVAIAIREAGWEFIGHGYRQRALHAEPDEAASVSAAVEKLRSFTGKPTRGWLGPGGQETNDTPDILKEVGLDYTLDWSIDDLPLWLATRHGPLLAVPYTFEINDSVLWAMNRYGSDEMHRRVLDSVATFERELAGNPRILTLALHPHLIGVPHRAVYLDRSLDVLQSRSDTVFVTGSEIADWYAAEDPPPAQ